MRLRTRAVAGDFKLHASHFFCDALGFFKERGPNSLAAVGLVHNEFKDLGDARCVVQLVFKAQVQYGACGGIRFLAGDKGSNNACSSLVWQTFRERAQRAADTSLAGK